MSAFCATCVHSESKCRSCMTGYELVSSKCISKARIIVGLLLDGNVDEFVVALVQFKL